MNTSDPVGSFSFSEIYQTPHPPQDKGWQSAFKKPSLSPMPVQEKTKQIAPMTIHSTEHHGTKERRFHSVALPKITGQVDKMQDPTQPGLIASGSFRQKPRSVSEPQPHRERLDLIEESRRAKSASLNDRLHEDGRMFAFDDELEELQALDDLETREKTNQ